MMTFKKTLIPSLLALGLAASSNPVGASSHREAPAISQDPVADNTDVYAWVQSGTHDKLNVVLCYNPMEEPAGGPNFNEFSPDVLYELHLTRGPSSLEDVYTYQFQFTKTPIARVNVADLGLAPGGGKEFFAQLSGQKMTMRVTRIEKGQASVIADGVPVAPPRIGPRTYDNFQKPQGGPAAYDDSFAATFVKPTSEGGKVWAGPRDDGFYVDLGGVFDAANLRPKGTAQDGVAGYNVHAIAIEIPTTRLTASGQAPGSTPGNNTLMGVWASASRRQISIRLRNGESFSFGPWVQVSRLGLPLVNEALIGLQDKDRWNYDRPSRESYYFPYFLNPVIVRDAEAVGIYQALGMSATPFKSNRTDLVDVINVKDFPTANAHSVPLSATGDVLRVDLAADSGFPLGRTLINTANPKQEGADVTDVLLSLLLTKQVSGVKDGVDYNDKPFLTTIPWLPLPWQGYNEGHGKPTP
ncbi:MAG: DUF4331 domain-containing protein [Polyangia bacterium]